MDGSRIPKQAMNYKSYDMVEETLDDRGTDGNIYNLVRNRQLPNSSITDEECEGMVFLDFSSL
jgi:hypothetical protein